MAQRRTSEEVAIDNLAKAESGLERTLNASIKAHTRIDSAGARVDSAKEALAKAQERLEKAEANLSSAYDARDKRDEMDQKARERVQQRQDELSLARTKEAEMGVVRLMKADREQLQTTVKEEPDKVLRSDRIATVRDSEACFAALVG
jgi:hypothetical protein